jgi:hypothetical protein
MEHAPTEQLSRSFDVLLNNPVFALIEFLAGAREAAVVV